MVIHLGEVDSTNDFLKRYEPCGDVIVVAERQTGGRGTKGRSFISDEGGLYLSLRRQYDSFPADRAFEIMVNACVAVCRTVEHFGAKPVIRWANDVLCGGKKICGTLIENTLSDGHICRSIVGIGLNVGNRLPDGLEGIATTLCRETAKDIPVADVERVLIENLQKNYTIDDYKNYINWLGSRITLRFNSYETEATALNIDGEGRLVCDIGGSRTAVSSAEVSLRI